MGRTLTSILFLLAFSVPCLIGETLPVMRISVENSTTHVQTLAVERFVRLLRTELEGQLDIRFYPAARLFRDKDVIQALFLGRVEMAVPGTWQFDTLVPEAALFLLPGFYGRPRELTYRVMDSPLGKRINRAVEEGLHVVIPGRWIDLGHAHLFSLSRPIHSYRDIDRMKIRVAGGQANMLRLEALGGIPRVISWPDLNAYLETGGIDAILTSYETVRSAALWEKGVRYVYEDSEYFAQYVPMISPEFWEELSPEIRRIICDCWESGVEQARREAAAAQIASRELLEARGVEIRIPSPEELHSARELLMEQQNAMAEILHIPDELLAELEAILAVPEDLSGRRNDN